MKEFYGLHEYCVVIKETVTIDNLGRESAHDCKIHNSVVKQWFGIGTPLLSQILAEDYSITNIPKML